MYPKKFILLTFSYRIKSTHVPTDCNTISPPDSMLVIYLFPQI